METVELTRELVSRWKSDPITKAIFFRVHLMMADLTGMLINGVQDYDYTRGFIQGLGFLLEWNLDEEEGEQTDGETK